MIPEVRAWTSMIEQELHLFDIYLTQYTTQSTHYASFTNNDILTHVGRVVITTIMMVYAHGKLYPV